MNLLIDSYFLSIVSEFSFRFPVAAPDMECGMPVILEPVGGCTPDRNDPPP